MNTILQLEGVVKKFGGLMAVGGVSLGVKKGESVGLVGPNGAGKTTLFSLIMGEHRADSGSIRFNGLELNQLPTHRRIRNGISRTYQIPKPFVEMDVLANIEVGLMPHSIISMLLTPFDHEEGRALARSVGLNEKDIHRTPAELSMGDLRKLELARAMATNPEVVLLDEVFAGLSTGEIAQISGLIAEKHQDGFTFVIVSHDLRSLEPLIDRAVALDRGMVICEGGYSEVMMDKAVRAAYLGN